MTSRSALVTDPPYYDAVPYGDLSDFFYFWFEANALGAFTRSVSHGLVAPKDEEMCPAFGARSAIYTSTRHVSILSQ